MPFFGPPDIDNMKAKCDIPGLLKALGHQKDENVREAAAKALGEIKDSRAVEPLITAFNNVDVSLYVRIAAAEALGKIGDARALKPLIAALKDTNLSVRLAAAETLGSLGDVRGVEPLVCTLKDVNQEVSQAAARAIIKLRLSPDAITTAQAWIAVYENKWDRIVSFGAASVEPLINQYNRLIAYSTSDKKGILQKIVDVLGNIGDVKATEFLKGALDALNKSNYRIDHESAKLLKLHIAAALVRLGQTNAIGLLLDALSLSQNPNYQKQIEYAETALISIGSTALEPLSKKVSTGSESLVRTFAKIGGIRSIELLLKTASTFAGNSGIARKVLSELGSPAVEILISHLNNSENTECRRAAAYALGKIGDSRAIDPLISQLADLRYDAAYALKQLSWTPSMNENGAIYNISLKDWDACVKMGDVAVEPLIAQLEERKNNSMDGSVLGNVASALGRIGDARAVAPLINALNDQIYFLREHATKALGEIGDARAVGPLLDALNITSYADSFYTSYLTQVVLALDKLGWTPTHDETGARYWVIKGDLDQCADLGDAAIEPLLQAMYSRADLREEIFKVLEKLGEAVVIEARSKLKKYLEDVDLRLERKKIAEQEDDIRDKERRDYESGASSKYNYG